MKLVIYTTDQGEVEVEDFDQSTAMDFLEALKSGYDQFLTLELDEHATVLINREHVVRVDIE